jgi:hypothetical protein
VADGEVAMEPSFKSNLAAFSTFNSPAKASRENSALVLTSKRCWVGSMLSFFVRSIL